MTVTFIHKSGDSNVIVYSLNSSGEEVDLLVNGIGSYRGTSLINIHEGDEVAAFKIDADSRWTLTVRPLSEARRWDGTGTLKGRGKEVVIISDAFSGLDSIKMTHTSGETNVVVYGYGESEDLIVNEIGNFTGEYLVPPGTEVLQIDADGVWTMRKV